MTSLHAIEDFNFTILTPEGAGDAASIVAESFADEPTGCFLDTDRGSRLAQLQLFTSFFEEQCAGNGLSVACIDKETGRMAGAVYLIDHKCTFPDIPFYKMPCLAPVIELVHEVEVIYDGLRPGLVVGDCAVVWMLGVHPDYRRRNIAQLLTDVSIRHAFASGFKYVILESTGSYSARCAQKAGMKAVVRKVYAETSGVLKDMYNEHPELIMWEKQREE